MLYWIYGTNFLGAKVIGSPGKNDSLLFHSKLF